MTPEIRDSIIDQYCDWFVKTADRKMLEAMAWDAIHEELHSMQNKLLMETIESNNPELFEI